MMGALADIQRRGEVMVGVMAEDARESAAVGGGLVGASEDGAEAAVGVNWVG